MKGISERYAMRGIKDAIWAFALPLLFIACLFCISLPKVLSGPHGEDLKARDTRRKCSIVANAVREYRIEFGNLPATVDPRTFPRVSNPVFARISDMLNRDGWGRYFKWQDTSDQLRIQLFDTSGRLAGTLPAPPEKDLYVYSFGKNGIDEKGAGDDMPDWDPDDNFLQYRSYVRKMYAWQFMVP